MRWLLGSVVLGREPEPEPERGRTRRLLRLVRRVRRPLFEAMLAIGLGVLALVMDGTWRFVCGVLAGVAGLILVRTKPGIWLLALGLAVALVVAPYRWEDARGSRWAFFALAVAFVSGALLWTRVPRVRSVAVEAVPAAAFGLIVLLVDDPRRWLAAIPAALFTLLLFRTDAGIRLLAAGLATGLVATAIFWEDVGEWRLAFVAAAVAATLVARWAGAVVWPDVAIILLVGLGVVAIRDAREPEPEPEPPRPPVAVFELPADRVRPPVDELGAPSPIEIIALTPKPGGGAGATTHESTQFEARLLTPVKRWGATDAVRVRVERGENGETARSLAAATRDATEFVVLPGRDCFVAPRRDDLTEVRARALLEGYGFSEDEAKSFADSFAGPIDFVPVLPGHEFKRYHSGNHVGLFLTERFYRTQTSARRGLALPPTNKAKIRQVVRVVAPTMALRGRIKKAVGDATQYFVLRAGCFSYAGGVGLRKE